MTSIYNVLHRHPNPEPLFIDQRVPVVRRLTRVFVEQAMAPVRGHARLMTIYGGLETIR